MRRRSNSRDSAGTPAVLLGTPHLVGTAVGVHAVSHLLGGAAACCHQPVVEQQRAPCWPAGMAPYGRSDRLVPAVLADC